MPKGKKPAAKNRPLERPSVINLNHGSKISSGYHCYSYYLSDYEESGSENDDVEEIERERTQRTQKK